mgnify:CR=1 FL=1
MTETQPCHSRPAASARTGNPGSGHILKNHPANVQKFPGAGVSVKDFGAVGDGVHDDTLSIQAALDSGAAHILIPAGVFVVSNAIMPRTGQSLEIRGTIKVADAHIRLLSADALAGQPCVEVADAGGFRPGQWVTLLADDSPMWQTRPHADGGRIAAVEGNTIFLAGRLTMDYRLAVRPRIATQPSAIWLDNVSHVRIYGPGTIDGNKANQLDVRPTVLEGCGLRADLSIGGAGGEEIRAACGIAASGAPGTLEYITIEGITVRDASEHNLCLTGLVFGRVLNTVCTGCRDKNITLLDSKDCIIAGNIASLSDHEDGIMFHQKTGNSRILVQGNICSGNPRMGIAAGAMETEIHFSGNLCSDNGCNLSIGGDDCSSANDACHGENYMRFARSAPPPGVSFYGKGTQVSNLCVSGDRLIHVDLAAKDLIWTGGSVRGTKNAGDNCGINLGESPCVGKGSVPDGILVRDVSIGECNVGVRARGEMKNVRLFDVSLAGNDRDIQADSRAAANVEVIGSNGSLSRRVTDKMT